MPTGDKGAANEDGPGSREPLAGEGARALLGAGDGARIVTGEAGRASFETVTEGLPGRGMPPIREVIEAAEGERGLGPFALACKRVI